MPNRREFIYGLGSSLGALALTDLLAADDKKKNAGPLIPQTTHASGPGQSGHHAVYGRGSVPNGYV